MGREDNRYLFRAILGDRSLENLWLVVTHAEDLAGHAQAQALWLRDARDSQQKLSEVLSLCARLLRCRRFSPLPLHPRRLCLALSLGRRLPVVVGLLGGLGA